MFTYMSGRFIEKHRGVLRQVVKRERYYPIIIGWLLATKTERNPVEVHQLPRFFLHSMVSGDQSVPCGTTGR